MLASEALRGGGFKLRLLSFVSGRDPVGEFFLSHELTHALQDQHYGLPTAPEPLTDAEGDRVLARIDQHLSEVSVPAGRLLIEQGEMAYEAFIIEDGVAEVLIDDEPVRDTEIGELIGELGILRNAPRAATVIAKTPMKLLVLDAREMDALLHEDSKVAERVQQNVERHLAGK